MWYTSLCMQRGLHYTDSTFTNWHHHKNGDIFFNNICQMSLCTHVLETKITQEFARYLTRLHAVHTNNNLSDHQQTAEYLNAYIAVVFSVLYQEL